MVDDVKQNGPGEEGKPAGADQAVKQGGDVKDHKLEDLKEEGKLSTPRDMEFLLDIPVEITAQLGTTRMLIKELLQLGQGSVIELEKLAGEAVEILANKRLVARGEVVVVNEKFGVRLTDVMSLSERVNKLK
jgi:flagellar motor switch protein FliN/FliY